MSVAKGKVQRRLRRKPLSHYSRNARGFKNRPDKNPNHVQSKPKFHSGCSYLSFLLKINLLEKITINEKTIYKTTQKGIRFLKRYKEIWDMSKQLY
jgi:hypothetical protein